MDKHVRCSFFTRGFCAALWVRGLLLASLLLIAGCGDDEGDVVTSSTTATSKTDASGTLADASLLPRPTLPTGTCRVYTSQPGFSLLVDGQPVHDEQGNLITTPCEVTALSGARELTLFREGHGDQIEIVAFSKDGEKVFATEAAQPNATSSVLAAPYYNAKIGEPIALDSLNSSGAEFDPCVSEDGLFIYFAADRGEGRGVFMATRSSPFEPFDEPELLKLSSSSDSRRTPGATLDGLLLVYAVPEKASVWSLTREDVLGEFDSKQALRASRNANAPWVSSQILGDGLRLYWVEQSPDGSMQAFSSNRTQRGQPFKKTFKVSLAGVHPCLSADGLRQYAFDGKTLTRSRRLSVKSKFVTTQTIAELDLPNYKASPSHRQYFLSDNEQWLFYCDDPLAGGDLHMLRVSRTPGWGVVAVGKTIPDRVIATAAAADKPADDVEKAKPVDPRSLSLPYTAHRTSLRKLLLERKYDEARRLIGQVAEATQLKDDAELIAWDAADLGQLDAFWLDVERALTELKPDDDVRIGSAKLKFVSFADGTIVAKSKSSEVVREMTALSAVNLLALFDRVNSNDDALAQRNAATFLFYDSKTRARSYALRVDRAADAGREFAEQLGERRYRQAEQEFQRGNFSPGLGFLNDITNVAPGSQALSRAAKLRESLYGFVKWNTVGPRKWKVAENTYEAELGRSPNSMLVSPRTYENFELTLEWKTVGGTGQGGVFFRYSGQGSPYKNALKIQFASDYGVTGDAFATGALFGIEAPRVNAVKAPGEWNTLLMRVRGDEVSVTINNRLALETTIAKPELPPNGLVALDGSVGGITYRKMLLSELPE